MHASSLYVLSYSWHPKTSVLEGGVIDCANIIMSDGLHHIDGKLHCHLCGLKDKVKVKCTDPKCRSTFHLTCARQAGLDVSEQDGNYVLKCHKHGGSNFPVVVLNYCL